MDVPLALKSGEMRTGQIILQPIPYVRRAASIARKVFAVARPLCGELATREILSPRLFPLAKEKPGVSRWIVQCRKVYLTDCPANGQARARFVPRLASAFRTRSIQFAVESC